MLHKKELHPWPKILTGIVIVLANLCFADIVQPSEQIFPGEAPYSYRVLCPNATLQEIANRGNARIYIERKRTNYVERAQGSAVLIAHQGNTYYALTNARVVQAVKGRYTLLTHDGQEHSLNAQEIKTLPNVDMAVVRFVSDQKYPLIELGDSEVLQKGQRIYLTGWAGGVLQYCSQGEFLGYLRQPIEQGITLVYNSNISNKGMSGGSLLDEKGRLIGIHSAIARPDNRSNSTGTTTVGLGIPINTLIELASQAGLDPDLIPIFNSSPSTSHNLFGQ